MEENLSSRISPYDGIVPFSLALPPTAAVSVIHGWSIFILPLSPVMRMSARRSNPPCLIFAIVAFRAYVCSKGSAMFDCPKQYLVPGEHERGEGSGEWKERHKGPSLPSNRVTHARTRRRRM